MSNPPYEFQFFFSLSIRLNSYIWGYCSGFFYCYSVGAKMEGPEVTFLFQFGNLRDMVTAPASSITLKSLKDMACDFINNKVCVFFLGFLVFFFYLAHPYCCKLLSFL